MLYPIQSNFNKFFSVVISISIKTIGSHGLSIGLRVVLEPYIRGTFQIRKTIGFVQSAIRTKPVELRGEGGTSLKEANGAVPLDRGRLSTNGLTIMESHIFGFLGKKNLHIYV